MPDIWVFPGGRVESQDSRLPTLRPLSPPVARQLEAHWSPTRVRALATAAIRETWEETGLAVGEVQGAELLPDHSALVYLGRAITPVGSAIRYHARFFMTSAEAASGRLRGNGELADLTWLPLDRALALPVIDVTIEMLQQIVRSDGDSASARPLFIHYRGRRLCVQHE
jgi:8-oxo-dGTP pyrophosphatase MutT (NUDIX family)